MLFTPIVTVENIPGYKCTLKGKRQILKQLNTMIGRLGDS